MTEKSSIFNMLGPIMIGPSSSHTAGVVRIGRIARRIFGQQPKNVEITFYNSFARTYEGHGSDRAIIGGLLDMKTHDEKIKDALTIAPDSNLSFIFKSVLNASTLHPNSIKISSTDESGNKKEVIGVSRGGGLVSIVGIDGFECGFTGEMHTLIINASDKEGSISFISGIIANDNCNIATMTVNRRAKKQDALLVMEMDSGIKKISLDYLAHLEWVNHVIYIPDIDL